jgi:hypothetical protein
MDTMAELYGLYFPEINPAQYQPLEAMVLIKGFDSHQRIRYREIATGGLGPMECYGMAMSAADTWRQVLMNGLRKAED